MLVSQLTELVSSVNVSFSFLEEYSWNKRLLTQHTLWKLKMKNLNIKHFQFKQYKDASCAFFIPRFLQASPLEVPSSYPWGLFILQSLAPPSPLVDKFPMALRPSTTAPYTSFVLYSHLLFHIQPSFMFISSFSAPSTELEAKEEEELIPPWRHLPKSRKPSAFQGLQERLLVRETGDHRNPKLLS